MLLNNQIAGILAVGQKLTNPLCISIAYDQFKIGKTNFLRYLEEQKKKKMKVNCNW